MMLMTSKVVLGSEKWWVCFAAKSNNKPVQCRDGLIENGPDPPQIRTGLTFEDKHSVCLEVLSHNASVFALNGDPVRLRCIKRPNGLGKLICGVIVTWGGEGWQTVFVQQRRLQHPFVCQQTIEHPLFHITRMLEGPLNL